MDTTKEEGVLLKIVGMYVLKCAKVPNVVIKRETAALNI